MMKVLGINHIGIAAKDPRKAAWFFETILKLPKGGEELVSEQQTNTIMFSAAQDQSTLDSRLEILENEAGKEGPIKKFLDKKGGGIHHVALQVDDVAAGIAYLKSCAIEMVDDAPRRGAHHTLVAFVHPRSTGGILVELVQEA